MQKSKLGISVGLLGALVYFTAMITGYSALWALLLVVGYVLLVEDNPWLRRSAVKAVLLVVFFMLIDVLWGLIPDIFAFIDKLMNLFDESLSGEFFEFIEFKLDPFILFTTNFVQKVLLLILGVQAFSQKTVIIPALEKIINKHIN